MKALQRVILVSLLIFVGVSVVYLAVGKQGTSNTSPVANGNVDVCSEGEQCGEEAPPRSNNSGVTTVAYYFHRTARCKTCRALEIAAREAIEGSFADELSNRILSVKSFNIEEPSNHHFIEQYQITGPSLVLSQMQGTKEVNWKDLDQIWRLIRTPAEYKAYIVSELESFMKAQS